MSDFTRTVSTLPGPPPDPAKRVNYTHGLVLGVDEFTQEFAYLSGRTTWLARDLLGYGTASGLQVLVRDDVDPGNGPHIVVAAGTAVSPSGRLIRVAAAQQADVDKWLAAHAHEVSRRADSSVGSPPSDTIAAHVVLCYRELPDDDRPVLGERCRTDDGPTVPSRVRDDFRLELRFDPPDQREDDASARFVHWLTQVEITDAGDDVVTLDEFLAEIRRTSPFPIADSGVPSLASPPQPIRIRPRDACEYMDAAFRVWATELRPQWMRPSRTAASDCDIPASDDDCVLLATIEIPVALVDRGWQVDRRATISVKEDHRPYLVHLRALQQWLLCAAERWSELDGDVTGPAGRTTVERLRHVPIAASPPPADREVLTFDGGESQWRPAPVPASATVVAETTFGQTGSAGSALDFSRGDHTHGTPALTGDVTVNREGRTVVGGIQTVPVSARGPTANQLLTYDGREWRPAALTGDVTVNREGSTVVGTLQEIPIIGTGAAGGQVMTFVTGATGVTGAWRPASLPPLPALAGDVTGAIGTNVITNIQGVPITATGAAGGQVMTFVTDVRGVTGVWRPANLPPPPPLPTLSGDATGSIGATVVERIQGKPIAATDPDDNQVLTFNRAAKIWEPRDPGGATGSFVEHPSSQPRYAIVAAGVIHATTAAPIPAPPYNGLKLVKFGTGVMLLTFTGYTQPSNSLQYIVKILPISESPRACVVTLGQFLADLFEVNVTLNGAPLDMAEFGKFRFMVEVSQYRAG